MPSKGHDMAYWHELVLNAFFAMFVVGLGSVLVSFISWIIAHVTAGRKAKADPSASSH
jgi:hypothetical protein